MEFVLCYLLNMQQTHAEYYVSGGHTWRGRVLILHSSEQLLVNKLSAWRMSIPAGLGSKVIP